MHTGDLGLMDKDGFIYIKGRSKNMLLGASGQNIYPEEIESLLNNMPCVGESLVISRNEQIIALVYPDYEIIDTEGLNEDELKTKMEEIRIELNKKLPSYSKVMKIELFPEEFEKTPTKKIKRFLYDK
jgi:long-chain acyl-CoA synthetase